MDELIKIEMYEYSCGAYADHGSARDQLTRFAEAVRAAERERCARIAEAGIAESDPGPHNIACMAIACSIRNSKQQCKSSSCVI